MKPLTAEGARLAALGQFVHLKLQGSTTFAAGLLALLLVIAGAPVVMVVLMSLRTGFPGEGGPLTLANFVDVYSDPGTYEVLVNTLFFAVGSVSVALFFAVPL